MIGASVEPSPWLPCDALSSFLQAGPQDWLSCLDFSDFTASSLSTQATDDLDELLNLDMPDFILPPEQNFLSADSSDGLPPFLDPDAEGGGIQGSNGFSAAFDLNESMFDQISFQTARTDVYHVDIVANGLTDTNSSPLKSQSPTVDSPYGSDTGSFCAREGLIIGVKEGNHTKEPSVLIDGMSDLGASSRKRHQEDASSDLDGADNEGRSRSEHLDKRQQRLLRNRELAFESRQRKKSYISDLEVKCKFLEQERNRLHQQLCLASAENAVLRKELSHAKKMKGKDGVAEPAVLFKDSLPLEFLSLLICILPMGQLSVSVSPFLALLVSTVLFPQSPTKVGRLEKNQVSDTRCLKWCFDHLWHHRPLVVFGLFLAMLTWQVPFLLVGQSACKPLRLFLKSYGALRLPGAIVTYV